MNCRGGEATPTRARQREELRASHCCAMKLMAQMMRVIVCKSGGNQDVANGKKKRVRVSERKSRRKGYWHP